MTHFPKLKKQEARRQRRVRGRVVTLIAAALAAATGPLVVSGCSGGNGGGPGVPAGFRAAGTFRVAAPAGSAEIAATTPDGRTLVFTDAGAGLVGFVNIADLAAISQIGTVALTGEPTSVAVTPDGRFALVTVDGGPNRLAVMDIATRTVVATHNLVGQPDSIAISPDGQFAAIAIENQRPDEALPLPIAPPGSLTIVRLSGAPTAWTLRNVALTGLAALRFASDPEPEFVDVSRDNKAAVTLQENNGIVIVDLASGAIERSFTAGTTTHAADLQNNGTIAFTDTLTDARREPDGISWTPRGNLITANEGDYDLDLAAGQFTGGRNFTIFSPNGSILFDDRGGMEQEVARAGRYPDNRSHRKGSEPEGVKVATIGERTYAFIALERADALAVYRLDNDSSPTFVQILPTGDAPEGIAFVPTRNLIITANEGDGTLSFFSP
jgi:DNA-binding beta-propeller fold protein YncE